MLLSAVFFKKIILSSTTILPTIASITRIDLIGIISIVILIVIVRITTIVSIAITICQNDDACCHS